MPSGFKVENGELVEHTPESESLKPDDKVLVEATVVRSYENGDLLLTVGSGRLVNVPKHLCHRVHRRHG